MCESEVCVQLSDLPFIEVTPDGGTLKVLGTQAADAGDYECVAENEAGISSAVVSLDVGCTSNPSLMSVFTADACF